MRGKRLLSILLVIALMMSLLTGCGGNDGNAANQSENQESNGSGTDEASFEGVTLKWAITETGAQSNEYLDLVKNIKTDLGIDIEFMITPTPKDGEIDRTLVSLTAGDELDILYGSTSKLKMYHSAGVLTAIDDYAAKNDYDMQAVFGENLPVFEGGTFGLPVYRDIWLTFYNKNVFDAAGVPYPDAEGWTWEKYTETAKLLTDKENDIWGSFMLDYNNYYYMYATQKGANPYKEDGTANFDDPLYAEALEFFAGLGNSEKIQPDVTTIYAGEYPWNAFAASDNLGMFVCGGWVTSLLKNFDKYPRDWKVGILPMPYPEGHDPSTLVTNGNYAVPVTSKNKEAAFEVIRYLAENQYKLGYGRVPSRIDLSDEEVTKYIEEELGGDFVNDGITVEDFRAGWFDAERIPYKEKIIGTADTAINLIWVEEAQMYAMGMKSLEETLNDIQERANRAIEEAQ